MVAWMNEPTAWMNEPTAPNNIGADWVVVYNSVGTTATVYFPVTSSAAFWYCGNSPGPAPLVRASTRRRVAFRPQLPDSDPWIPRSLAPPRAPAWPAVLRRFRGDL